MYILMLVVGSISAGQLVDSVVGFVRSFHLDSVDHGQMSVAALEIACTVVPAEIAFVAEADACSHNSLDCHTHWK